MLLVSSGAIALGRNGHSSELDKRIAAAKGQVALMTGWREVFAMHAIDVCQVLVSNGCQIDFNALSSATTQLVINGNDVIEETNNDLVASKVARNTNADLLVLLTNVDGYLDGTGKRISSMDAQDAQFDASTVSEFGTGGIATKLQAIREAAITAVIANGAEHSVLSRILAGEVPTRFSRPLSGSAGTR